MPRFKTALVTGGAGFIGSHVVDALIKRRVKVYVIDDLSTGKKANLNPNATFYKASILDARLPKLVAKLKPDVVFHLAAQIDVRKSVENPAGDAEVNVVGTVRLMDAAAKAGTKKFIFTSSGGAMFSDDVRFPCAESVAADPVSPYGIAKRAGEMYLGFESSVHKMPYVVLRLANVYGPRQSLSGGYAGVISKFSQTMLMGKPCVITGTGKQTRDYVYVGDVVRAQMLAMEKSVTGIFHVGTGVETSVLALFKKISKLSGSKQKEAFIPAFAGEVMRSALDATKAAKELGWKAETRLDDGLAKTVEWFQKNAAR